MDIVQEYRNTQTEINQLTDVQLPTLELADIKSLALSGEFTKVHLVKELHGGSEELFPLTVLMLTSTLLKTKSSNNVWKIIYHYS